MISLSIDASTYEGSVAVVRDGRIAAEVSAKMRGVEREGLMPAVAEVLVRSGASVDALHRIVCGSGPGSFTSLRIAASIAKGLALGLDLPLFAVPSLGLMAGSPNVLAGRYVVTLDALRGEWYAGVYERDGDGQVDEIAGPRLVDQLGIEALASWCGGRILAAVGATASESPRASAVLALERLITNCGPVDRESWEPGYGRLAQAQVSWEAAHGRQLRSP